MDTQAYASESGIIGRDGRPNSQTPSPKAMLDASIIHNHHFLDGPDSLLTMILFGVANLTKLQAR